MFCVKKTTKCKEKVRGKCAKTAISGIFPAFSVRKKLFSKVGLGHASSIPNTHLCAKSQKKLDEISRKCQKKNGFPAYFRHLRPEKYVFRKSGSVTFQILSFCISVQNFMNKYKVRLQKFKKYRFSGENQLFRQFLESSGYKNQFN